mmetsp:Transcript_49319/g.96756  ORF Transcript_49319/g.96756 Transcript_49319/m.96756 type:complete len:215 (+) Transcript_49319:164-808(+)
MPPEVETSPHLHTVIEVQEQEGEHEIVGQKRDTKPTHNLVSERIVAYIGIRFAPDCSLDVRQPRCAEEEQVVPRVEAMPESTDSIGSEQTAVSADIHVPLQPSLSAHIPAAAQCSCCGSCFKAYHINRPDSAPPAKATSLVLVALVAEPSCYARPFSHSPGEVVLVPGDCRSEPRPAYPGQQRQTLYFLVRPQHPDREPGADQLEEDDMCDRLA